MKSSLTKGIICLKDNLNIEYRICIIEYLLNEDETFEYHFYPNYEVIELLNNDTFQGIPGLDLELKRRVYVRKNMVPVFISERVPSKNREDYYELLKKVNMTYMDPIEYLIKSKEKYSGDNFYLISYEETRKIDIDKIKKKANTFGITKMILQTMASNNQVYLDGHKINDKKVFKTLYYLYKMQYQTLKKKQKKGIISAQKNDHYVGRRQSYVDILALNDLLEKVKRKELTNKKAAEILGISIDKYYRTIKRLQNENDTLLQLHDINKN